jgi:trans-aconitate methyltransferase
MSNAHTRLPADQQPRLYTDLAWVWPFISPLEDYPEEVETFRARFTRNGVSDGAPVLHLGSGGGSIDWHLKRHYRVTGVDLNPGMLAHARSLNPEVEYLEGDIREVRLGREFAAVLLHDAAAYMTMPEDLRAAYRTAAAHLAPGGVLVTPPEELRSRFRQHRVQAETHERGERAVTTVTVDFDPDPADTWFEQTYVILIRRSGQPLHVVTDTHRCGLYDLDEILKLLREVGFEPQVERWELADLPPGDEYPLITAVKRPVE